MESVRLRFACRQRAPQPRIALGLAVLIIALSAAPSVSIAQEVKPHVLIVSVDTLRADRVSSYGYSRQTSPNIDALLAGGVRFSEARTVEPLTGPGLSSMLTALYPQNHGATRNGLRMRKGPAFVDARSSSVAATRLRRSLATGRSTMTSPGWLSTSITSSRC